METATDIPALRCSPPRSWDSRPRRNGIGTLHSLGNPCTPHLHPRTPYFLPRSPPGADVGKTLHFVSAAK